MLIKRSRKCFNAPVPVVNNPATHPPVSSK